MIYRKLAMAILATSVMLLHGCFTGVESTPTITSKDVKKLNAAEQSVETVYVGDIKPQPMGEWHEGKKFYVTDDKIYIIFNALSDTSKFPHTGDTISFLRAIPAMSLTGNDATDLVFRMPDGLTEGVYRVGAKEEELKSRKYMEMPFAIDLDVISTLDHKLKGEKLFTLTPLWYSLDDKATKGRRFVEVTVEEVLPGNLVYPAKVVFIDADGVKSCMMMSLGAQGSPARTFPMLFSLTDPHMKYPKITDENWVLIQNSQVASGMTRDECRLAMGAPDEIDRRPSSMGLTEIWSYNSGQFLVFQDGLLYRFRR